MKQADWSAAGRIETASVEVRTPHDAIERGLIRGGQSRLFTLRFTPMEAKT